jgi:hypothetical protein
LLWPGVRRSCSSNSFDLLRQFFGLMLLIERLNQFVDLPFMMSSSL